LKHLGSTLKHLSIWEYAHVRDLDQLTNLEVLEVCNNLPADFFKAHGQLPLQHLLTYPGYCNPLFSTSQAWQASPKTLVQLTLNLESKYDILPGVLPSSITHLQLLNAHKDSIAQASEAVASLRAFDIGMDTSRIEGDLNDVFSPIETMTNLQSLGLCMYEGYHAFWYRKHVLASLPQVARALEKGVRLTVWVDYNEFKDACRVVTGYKMSAWATRV
jgi:hypothetical protein